MTTRAGRDPARSLLRSPVQRPDQVRGGEQPGEPGCDDHGRDGDDGDQAADEVDAGQVPRGSLYLEADKNEQGSVEREGGQ
jgi:hypothetical protein